MTNQEAKDRLIALRTSYKIRIEEEDIEALDKGIAMLEDKTGHWLEVFKVSVVGARVSCNEFSCSRCNNTFDYRWDYCPNCGAKMKGE